MYKIYIDGIWRCFGQGKIVLPRNSAFRACKVQGLQGAALQAKVQTLHMGDFEKCPGGGYYFTLKIFF